MPNDLQDPFYVENPKNVGKDAKMVGGYVPRRLADYVTLLAVFHNTTTSDIFRRMVNYWVEHEEPEDSIIRILANRAYKEWVRRLNKYRGQSKWSTPDEIMARFREYEYELKLRLYKRRMPEPKAVEVIQRMEIMYGVYDGTW